MAEVEWKPDEYLASLKKNYALALMNEVKKRQSPRQVYRDLHAILVPVGVKVGVKWVCSVRVLVVHLMKNRGGF